MIGDYINNLEFYNNISLSIEDKIGDLFGDVCFYNGKGIRGGRGGRMARSKEFSFKDGILLDIAQINPKNKKQINEYAKDTIEYATRLENAPRPAILRVNKEPR